MAYLIRFASKNWLSANSRRGWKSESFSSRASSRVDETVAFGKIAEMILSISITDSSPRLSLMSEFLFMIFPILVVDEVISLGVVELISE